MTFSASKVYKDDPPLWGHVLMGGALPLRKVARHDRPIACVQQMPERSWVQHLQIRNPSTDITTLTLA
jgi:hypothetical protein